MTLAEILVLIRKDWRTIDELMHGKQPGEVKVHKIIWDEGRYFVPYFKDARGNWYGLDEKGEFTSFKQERKFLLFIE